jgi:hypothetical protein
MVAAMEPPLALECRRPLATAWNLVPILEATG